MYWMNRSSMAGNLVYTLVPGLLSGLSFMYMFRYSTNTNYYNRFIADNTVTDWFKLGDMIQGWGGVGLWTLAFLTSLMASFGVLVDFNVIVWVWFIIILGSTATISAFIFKFIAFESAWKNLDDLKFGTTANAAYTNIQIDFAVHAGVNAAIASIFYFYFDDWKYAMWEAKGLEGQEAEITELLAEIDQMEAEMGYVKPKVVESKSETETQEETSDETADATAEGDE